MKWLNLSPKQRRDAARPQHGFYPMPPFFGIWGWFLTCGQCRWHWVKTGLPSTTGWWWLEHDWIVTFQKQLGMECHHPNWRSPSLFRGVGWNHQAGMVSIGESTHRFLCYALPRDWKKKVAPVETPWLQDWLLRHPRKLQSRHSPYQLIPESCFPQDCWSRSKHHAWS